MSLRSMRKRSFLYVSLVVSLTIVAVASAPASAESGDSRVEGWGQLNAFECCLGPSLDFDDVYGTASVMTLRGTGWGIRGFEFHAYEFVRPGGVTERDKHSFLPVYLHLAPWVWRTPSPGRYGGTRTSVVCAFAGGSAWAFRSDNPEPRADDDPNRGFDWGHYYVRAGVRYIREVTNGSIGVECGVVLSPADERPDIEALSSYVGLHWSVGLTE